MAKTREDEKLDPANLEKVIKLLEDEKPITKKDACAMLNIAYNTTRLASIIDKHKEKVLRDQQKRKEKRGTPATTDEIRYVIEGYLEGSAVEMLSDTIYRSSAFVKAILEQYQVPIRARAHDYFKPELIPEGAVREVFEIGEVVYSARYDSTARIEDEFPHPDERVYRVWLLSDRWSQYAYQPASELASLKHLAELGVRV